MTPLEAAARAIAQQFIPAYADDIAWAEDLPHLKGRGARGAKGQDNPFGLARAAISAYLKACAEDEDMRTRTELRILEQFTGGMRYDRAVDHWLCPSSEQAARNLISNARVAVLAALEPKE